MLVISLDTDNEPSPQTLQDSSSSEILSTLSYSINKKSLSEWKQKNSEREENSGHKFRNDRNIYPHCKNFKSQLNSQVTRIATEKTFADSQPELKERNNNTPSAKYLKGQHLRKNYSDWPQSDHKIPSYAM